MAAGDINDATLAALTEQGGTDDKTKATESKGDVATENTESDTLEFKSQESAEESNSDVSKDAGDTDKKPEVDKAQKLKDAGIDPDALAKQIKETGKIPDDVIAKAKEVLDPAEVDAAVAKVQVALDADKVINTMNDFIYDSVGGKDKFDLLSDTLKDKLSDSDLALLNAKIGSGNKLLVEEGMKAAIKAYNDTKGMGGKLMSGEPSGEAKSEALPRVTKEQFRTITASDKYKTDKVYADKMDAARMATSKVDKISYGPGQYYGFTNGQRYEL